MPHLTWRHDCCPDASWFRPRARECPHCGRPGIPDGLGLSMIEMMAHYQRARGLKAIGPHRNLADELLGSMRTRCERCRGSGIIAPGDGRLWADCPVCEGGGGVWSASEEALVAAYRRILAEYPDARVPGALSEWGLPADGHPADP